MKIVLGSASPRRQLLLKEVFGEVEVRVKNVDESFPGHLTAEQITLYLAEAKAKALKSGIKANELIITADTIVWLDDHVLNKPLNSDDALVMLKKLSGRSHQVFTGVCISTRKKIKCFCVESKVSFRKMKEFDLIHYIRHYKPFDKAGSYGAQESLPEGMNPLSPKEKYFLELIGKRDLFEKSLSVKDHARAPLIEKIEGSYFNVMGLPVAELYDVLKSDFVN